MDLKKQAEEVFLWAKTQHEYSVAWESHSYNVARSAEKIASRMRQKQLEAGLDTEKCIDPDCAYACGLLHDIGRSAGKYVGLEHPIYGYSMLMGRGLRIQAQVAMTHTYYGFNKIDRTEFWEEFTNKDDLQFTLDYMEKVKINDYDRLIQLVDNMAHYTGIMTISDRFSDIVMRHNLRDSGAHLRELYRLKSYFDKKCDLDIYELFREEIIKTTFNGPDEPVRQSRKKYSDDN